MDSNQDGRINFDEFIECLESGVRGLTPMLQSLVPPRREGDAAAAPAAAASASNAADAAAAVAAAAAGHESADVQEPPSKRSK